MATRTTQPLSWPQSIRALMRAWKPLVVYELLVGLLTTTVLGPPLVLVFYRLIELAGEPVLGNLELARFLLSPLGLVALVVVPSIAAALVLVHYSGLILLADAAIGGRTLSLVQLLRTMIAAAPRLLGLALVQVSLALAAAVPFVGLAALVYWLLVSEADINYYLDARPPRFWLAAAIGAVLAAGLAAAWAWIFIRWAFALPACVLHGQGPVQAIRASGTLARGRGARLLAWVVAWVAVEQLTVFAAIWMLDRFNATLASTFQERLSMLVWSTVALLLVDTAVLQVIAAIFAIGLAALIAWQYQQACQVANAAGAPRETLTLTAVRPALSAVRPSWQARSAVLALAVAGPTLSIVSAVALARTVVEHRTARVTAHRAGSKAAPENSLAALKRALAAGADCVEIDVQQTADGQVVLMHDRDLRRMAGDPRDVNDVTLADLRPLRLTPSGGADDEPIPTLAEFLAACDDRVRLNVELKDFGRTPGLALAVVEVLRQAGFIGRAGVSCFDLPPLVEISAAEPKIPVGKILSAAQGDLTRLPVDFLSLHQRMVTANLVRAAHAQQMEIHAWTVNDRDAALRLLDLGADNLITSDPALMREVVDWYQGRDDVERVLMRLRRWMRGE